MTTGETEETSGGHEETREGNMKPPRSVTALSTIAVQAGQSLIVVSVLKSGSLVHLQLVQVCPGLCELGSDQQENQQLMEEQQQLLLKLQKHEGEVLSAVEKNRQKERGRDEGVMEKRQEEEQEAEGEEEVQSAMEASLSEGWSLLLQLLLRRQEVLKLAAEFYRRALEFSVSLDRFEGLQIKQDDELMDLQLTYDSMRKDLLGKSLQVLSSSSVLLQKLRQLQVTEALQRRGGVLQHENQDQESSQCSRGVVLRLEQLVEALQDRRRRADQTIRLQIQQEKEQQESREKSFHDWVLAIEEVQDQDLQSGSTSAESSDLESDSRPGELKSDSKPEETKDLQSGSVSDQTPQLRLDLKAESRLDAKPESGSEDTRNLVSGSRLKLKTVSISEAIKNLQSGFKLNLTAGSGSDPMLDKPEQTRDLQPGTTVDQMPQSKLKPKPESRLDVKPESISEEIKDLQAGIRSVQMPESRSNHSSDSKSEETKDPGPRLDQAPQARIELISESKSDVKPESRQDESRNFKPGPKPEETKNPQTGSSLEQKKLKPLSEVTKNLQSGFRFNLMAGSRPDPKSDKPQETRNLHPGSGLNLKEESRSELKTETRLDRSEEKKDLQPGSGLDETPQLRIDLKTESKSNVKPESRQEKSKNLKPGPKPDDQTRSSLEQKPESRSKMKPESRLSISEETTGPQPEPRSDQMPGSRSDLESDSKAEETRDLQSGSRLDVKPESRSESTTVLQSQFRSDETIEVRFDFKSVVQIESRLDVKPECKSPQNLQSGLKLNLMPGSRSDKPEQTRDLQPGSSSEQKQGLKQTKDVARMKSGSRSDLKTESKSEIKPDSRSEKNKNFKPEVKLEQTKDLQPGSRSELKNQSRSDRSEETDPKSDSRSEETRDLQPELKTEPGLHLSPEKTRDLEPECRSDLRSESRSVESIELQFGFKSVVQIESRLHVKPETRNLQSRSTSVQNEDLQLESSEQAGESECMLGNETQGEEGHAHQTLLTNQRLQLLSSCEHFINKVSGWVQQGSRVLSSISEAGRQLCEAEEALNKHLQLNRQAESAGQDAENLKQILDQIRALQTSRQLSPLKALTEQLKRGGTGGNRTRSGTSTAQLGPPAADPPSPELAARVDRVLNELQSLNRRIDSNIQLLKPFVSFLRMAQQVEEEMQEQMEVYRRRPEEEIAGSSSSPLRKKKKKQVDTWQETLQRFLTCQELGNSYNQNITNQVSEATLNLEAMQSAVHQVLERLNKIKQEVNKLQSQQLIQIQQQQESCRKYQERLNKTLQDLNCVSEMLDSCTLMDLGSDLQTSKLLERFSQARPHFTNLDAEVEFIVKSWETLRGVQDRLEEEELKGGVVKEENLSELLQLQDRVKNKILQSESILDLTSSFHLAAKQLEALLQSEPISPSTGPAGSCGSSESEQQIQSLFNTASRLKTEICAAVQHCGGTSFRAEQLEARLLSLDALRVSWLNEAARREEKLRRERLVRLLNDDINQLRDSFKELKKRFNNLRFNYLKRNDRTRNMKAVRNQLQQVELYEEKLQALRKRLQGVTARLGSEVKDGGVAREVEDAVNELQRQMGEFERSVCEHQKTLDMTCKLQQAMEEYQFWCEDASATITRVGKFSSECRSTEAVAVLYRQFEKFVWPTVPQQEERISQITELAVRLHGAEEGQRYIEKTVSKHSEMVESIRELSDGLIKLEAKLKLENLKQQQDDREKEMKEEKDTEEKDEVEDEEKDKEEEEVEKKEKRKMMRKEQRDNRSTQEASDMYELKETGHTPELTTKHDGKEVPIKRQTAANRKPPLQKSRSLDSDRQTESRLQHTSSYCSTHTFSLSCSPADTNRRVHAIHSQSQPAEPQATLPPCVIGHSFSDIQREFQRKEMQDVDAELHQQEVMTEDSLSNDEYDCVSPDDISLPPMAETPESNMFQSDIEEGFCFSSHSVHQYSHQSEHSGAGTATGAVRQQRGCSQTESSPTPPTSRHSSSRHRSDSSSCVQSSLTVPVQSLVTSTLSGVLKVEKTSKAIPPPSADISLSHPEPSFPSESNPVHKSNTADSCSNKDNDVQKSLSHSQSQPLLKEFKSQYNQPHVSLNTKGKNTQCAASKGETFPQTDPSPKVAEFSHSTTFPQSSSYRQPFIAADPNLYKEKTLPQDTGNHDNSTTIPKTTVSTCQDFENVHHQDMNCHQTMKESSLDSKSPKKSLSSTCTSTSKVTHKTIYFQSPPLDSHQTLPQVSSSLSSQQEIPLSQTETLPQINPVSQAKGLPQSTGIPDPVVHENRTRDTGFFKSSATLLQTTITLPQEGNFSQSYLDARNGLDQDVPSSKNSKDTPSVSVSTSNSLITAATVTQQFYCQSSPSYSQSNVPQAISNLGSQEESSHSQDSGLPEVNAPNPQEPNSYSSINISSSTITNSNRISSHQSHHQTVYSLHESLTSICTQQCMHDPGMTPSSPAKPAAPPQPEPQPQALAQQANPHVILLSSSPHLLTPDQDPNICQPVAIREEIKLTPQIQGPPLPAPPPLPQAQAESLPKGKDSKPGPPCITRPLSRATVMEGSPVTLEVEVTEHPEPKLNWCKDGAVSASGPGQALLSCQDGNHFLFNHEAPDSDGGLYEAQAGKHHNSSGDKWLVSEVFDIISVDWQTWFGTLCVLLWLIYLIIL